MNVTIATMAAAPSVRNDSPAKLANCSVPGMERHEIGMVYRNDWYRNESFRKPEWSTGCSLKCDYSLIFDDGSIARFHQSMSTAATLLISFSSISLLIYLLTFKSNVRRQLRECSCALSFTFLLIGVVMHLYLGHSWHCSSSFLCPLSTFLSVFLSLSCSVLYLFFSSNVLLELKSFFHSLSLHPKQIDKLPYRWAHLIAWCTMFLIAAVLTTIALPDYATKSGSDLQPHPVAKICFFLQRVADLRRGVDSRALYRPLRRMYLLLSLQYFKTFAAFGLSLPKWPMEHSTICTSPQCPVVLLIVSLECDDLRI
jgi:hypothetical protein